MKIIFLNTFQNSTFVQRLFMGITVLFFGMATDLVGESSIHFPLSKEISLEEFKTILIQNYPSLAEMHQYAIAINETYAEVDSSIKPGDTVAIIPPVSGG